VDKLAELTDGYTGADIAAMSAIKDQISSWDKNNITRGHKQHLTISMKHMETGLQKISKKGKGIRNTEII
jgi:SpoVK/Ycf46/Vps4 family AAA+-type ATPase